MSEPLTIGVVGATGLVGIEMLEILKKDSELSEAKVFKFASTARTNDGILGFKENKNVLSQCRYILNATGNDVAEEIASAMTDEQILIDNSSQFRLDPAVPLIVPEINADLLLSNPKIIANPNCTAILLCLTLNPFKEIGLNRVIVSTYQAASGAGIKGLEELERQMKQVAQGEKPTGGPVFKFPLAANVMSHNSGIRPEDVIGAGYNEEEWKVIEETRKILDLRSLPISVTSVRVPVRRAHAESVTVDLKQDIPLKEVRDIFAKARGLRVIDGWTDNYFPMPLEAEGCDEILVGRFRKDVTLGKTLHWFLAGDQLRKGAALNAVQILKTHLKGFLSSSN